MGFFIFQWLVMVVGLAVHFAIDRAPLRHTARRFFELGALWVVVGNGVFAIVGGFFHIGPNSASIAEQIGYTQSMFQWEVGWADIAIGVLSVLCVRHALRGQWMTAAITALTISFVGDGIGHIMQLVAHHNTAVDNVTSMPSDFLIPALAILFTALYRRSVKRDAQVAGQVAGQQQRTPVAA